MATGSMEEAEGRDALREKVQALELQIDKLKRQSATDVKVMGEIDRARDTIAAERDAALRLNGELLEIVRRLGLPGGFCADCGTLGHELGCKILAVLKQTEKPHCTNCGAVLEDASEKDIRTCFNCA